MHQMPPFMISLIARHEAQTTGGIIGLVIYTVVYCEVFTCLQWEKGLVQGGWQCRTVLGRFWGKHPPSTENSTGNYYHFPIDSFQSRDKTPVTAAQACQFFIFFTATSQKNKTKVFLKTTCKFCPFSIHIKHPRQYFNHKQCDTTT